MIKAKNLTIGYNGTPLISNISFELNPKEIILFMGGSGTGKTTLLKNLSLIERPVAGELIVDDMKFKFPSAQKDSDKIYPTINMVFQQLFLWPHLNNLENILLANDKFRNSTKLDTLIEILAIREILHKFPNECSLGQQQRIAIARGLLGDSKYLLLDEITSSLDEENSINILGYVFKIVKELEIGVILISHQFFDIFKNATKIYNFNKNSFILNETANQNP